MTRTKIGRLVGMLVQISKAALLALSFLCLLIPYSGTYRKVMRTYGSYYGSKTATLDSSHVSENFFGRIERLDSYGSNFVLEYIFLFLLIAALIIAVLGIFPKLKLFKKIYFAIPTLATLVVFLWYVIDHDAWHVRKLSSVYSYSLEGHITFEMWSGGTIPILIFIITVLSLQIADAFILPRIFKESPAEEGTAGVETSDADVTTAETEVAVAAEAVNAADELRKYKELYDAGVITEDEFNAKKKQLLGL